MASVHKKKGLSPYYYAFWYDSTGKQKSKSTKTTNKNEALKIAKRYELEEKYIKSQTENLVKKLLNNPDLLKEINEIIYMKSKNFQNDINQFKENFKQPEITEDEYVNQIINYSGDDPELLLERDIYISEINNEENRKKDQALQLQKQQEEENKKEQFISSFSLGSIKETILDAEYFGFSYRTIEGWKTSLNNLENFGIYNLLDFSNTPKLITNYKNHLIKDRDFKPVTVNKNFTTLKNLFNKVIKYNGYEETKNPFNFYQKIKEEINEVKIVSEATTLENIKRYEKLGKLDVMWVFLVGFYTGLRRDELRNFDNSWLDENLNFLTVPARFKNFTSKSRRYRKIKIPTELKIYFLKYKILEKNIKIDDRKFDEEKAKNGWNFSIHNLRKSFASYLLKNNYNILTIKNYLGHSDIKTTMLYLKDIYFENETNGF